MDSDEYLKGRLEDQIDWYDRKSMWNQRCYKRLRILEMVAAASIPFLAGLIGAASVDTWNMGLRIAAGGFGVLVAAISGILALGSYQELWVSYRGTCEMLRHHRFLYLTNTQPYDGADAFERLVTNVEGLISKEHSQWTKLIQPEKGPSGSPPQQARQ